MLHRDHRLSRDMAAGEDGVYGGGAATGGGKGKGSRQKKGDELICISTRVPTQYEGRQSQRFHLEGTSALKRGRMRRRAACMHVPHPKCIGARHEETMAVAVHSNGSRYLSNSI